MIRHALGALGKTLADRGLRYHIAVIGGSALLLRGLIDRPTQDVDALAFAEGDDPLTSRFELPPPLAQAAADVATALGIPSDWLNAGCVAHLDGKTPTDFAAEADVHVFGEALAVSVLGRRDLIRFKLYAAADEGFGSWHLHDLMTMRVTAQEVEQAREWVIDVANQHPNLVADVVTALLEYDRGH